MSSRLKLILLIAAVVAFGIVLALVLRSRLVRRGPAPATIAPTAVPSLPAPEKPEALPAGLATTTPKAPALGSVEASQEEVKNMARLFAERYGSYGPETNFQNLKDVEPMVTATMAAYLDTVTGLPLLGGNPVTTVTRAISAEIRQWSDARALVGVTTQREETTGGTQTVIYQPLRVLLLKASGEWKVDGAWWE